MSDQELVRECLAGSRAAQAELFRQHSRKMMAVCVRYTGNRQEAEDVLQDGFIKVFEKLSQWRGEGPLGGWIRMVIVNTALTHLRNSRKWKISASLEDAEDLDAEDVNALEHMSAQDLMDMVSRMPAGYRTVFNLFAVEGYGHKEIGEMMGITESTSKTQLLKAKAWLKRAIIAQEGSLDTTR